MGLWVETRVGWGASIEIGRPGRSLLQSCRSEIIVACIRMVIVEVQVIGISVYFEGRTDGVDVMYETKEKSKVTSCKSRVTF